jgi:hypothetical protein
MGSDGMLGQDRAASIVPLGGGPEASDALPHTMPRGRPTRSRPAPRSTRTEWPSPGLCCAASSWRQVRWQCRLQWGDCKANLVQVLPRGLLRHFDRKCSEICGARSPVFLVGRLSRLCRFPLALYASLFVNCCEFHRGSPGPVAPSSTRGSTWRSPLGSRS